MLKPFLGNAKLGAIHNGPESGQVMNSQYVITVECTWALRPTCFERVIYRRGTDNLRMYTHYGETCDYWDNSLLFTAQYIAQQINLFAEESWDRVETNTVLAMLTAMDNMPETLQYNILLGDHMTTIGFGQQY